MAGKISDLTALAGSALAAADYVEVLDSSASANKKLLASALSLVDGGAKTACFTAAVGEFYRVDLNTPPTETFTAATSDVLTFATLNPIDGQIFRVASSTTLPAGLTAATTYYAVSSSGHTCKLSLTKGGTPVDITSTGTGTHTATFSIVVTFPASPSVGDRFGYLLARSNTIYDLFPDRNSSNLMGGTDPESYNLYIQGESLVWTYDSTSSGCGWYLTRDGDGRMAGFATMYRTSNQTVNGVTKITSLSTVNDRGGLADTTNNRVNIRRTGKYSVDAIARIVAVSIVSTVSFAKNGTNYRFGDFYGATNGDHVSCLSSTNQAFTAGNYIELNVYASASTTTDTSGADYPTQIELREEF